MDFVGGGDFVLQHFREDSVRGRFCPGGFCPGFSFISVHYITLSLGAQFPLRLCYESCKESSSLLHCCFFFCLLLMLSFVCCRWVKVAKQK